VSRKFKLRHYRLIGALDDLQPPVASVPHLGGRDIPLVAAVGEDHLEEGEQRAGCLVQDQGGAVTVLDVGRVDGDVQEQAERVGQVEGPSTISHHLKPSLAGRIGTITTVHRETFLGEVVVTVPPRGRQKKSREAWLRIGTGAFEHVD
jgi:hypothetical protein